MIELNRKGIKLSREHIHSPVKITSFFIVLTCGQVVGVKNQNENEAKKLYRCSSNDRGLCDSFSQ